MRVKAVVMTRDDSSGGWLAQDGCLSRVGVCRLLPTGLLGRNAFLIHGERLKDRQVGATAGHVTDLSFSAKVKSPDTTRRWRRGPHAIRLVSVALLLLHQLLYRCVTWATGENDASSCLGPVSPYWSVAIRSR